MVVYHARENGFGRFRSMWLDEFDDKMHGDLLILVERMVSCAVNCHSLILKGSLTSRIKHHIMEQKI